jgi:ABC-type multidrug transport system fused ATPase/permease subunit
VRAAGDIRKGHILLRFVNDISALRQWISLGIARALVSSLVLFGGMLAIILINPQIGIALSLLILAGTGGVLLRGRLIDATIREARRRRANIAGNLTEKLHNLAVIQSYAQRRTERLKVRRQSNSLRKAMIRRAFAIGSLRGLVHTIMGLSLGAAAVIGLLNVRAGNATAGEVMAAISIASFVTPSLFDFGRVYEYWRSANISAEKTVKLLNYGPIIPPSTDPSPLRKVKGAIAFQNVSIEGAFKELSFSAKARTFAVLTGPNGAGKTTLLHLALRLMDPDKGKVLLDGRDLRSIRTGDLRRAVSIASADIPLLRGTIKSNLAYGSSKAREADITYAASLCQMDLSSHDSPFYFDRPVREGGVNLSAGQRMRVILARALVTRPKVLLLDEPEDNLDSSGLDILNHLLSSFDGTILMSTHDDSMIARADIIYQLENGAIKVCGNV